MPTGKKNWAFREISNMLDHNYNLTTEEQLEVAERLVKALQFVIEDETDEADAMAEKRRALFKIVSA